MKTKKRPLKAKHPGCPQWILEKVREIRIAATTRPAPVGGQHVRSEKSGTEK